MANMNVTYDEMRDAAARLRQGQEDATRILMVELKSQVDNLVANGFVTDQASGAFQASYEQFASGAAQVLEGLDGMASYLVTAADTLQQTDEQLAQGIRG
ncbi:WXG100 family type VII secretion target [Oerskovia sp. M15]